APVGGASGTFTGSGTSVTVVTDVGGYASPPLFIANAMGGSYQVTASVSGVTDPAVFHLNNLPHEPPPPPPFQDVTAQFRVILGKSLYSRATRRSRRNVSLRFTGGAALHGPFWLVLVDVSRQARLQRQTGVTQTFSPQGSPYLALGPSAFNPRAFLTVTLVF